MPYPTPPDIATSYTAFEQSQGDGSFPGQELDVDLATVAASVGAVIQFLQGIARSDGKIANQSVGREQLSTEVLLGFTPPTTWTTGVAYKAANTVFQGTGFYLCNVNHTAGDFASDLAAGRWTLLADINASGALIAGNNLSDLPDAAAARTNLGLGTMAQQNATAISVGNMVGAYGRVTTDEESIFDLQTRFSDDTHERARWFKNLIGYGLQTTNNTATERVTDYFVTTGPNGAVKHEAFVEGVLRFAFDDDSYTFGDAAQARVALSAMPAVRSSPGFGQILTLDAANGAPLSLPGNSAQTYWFWYIPQTVSGGALGVSTVGVSPGGTLLNAGASGVILRGFCIRQT